MNPPEVIHTQIWEETPESNNPFAAAACYCHGYDVYGDLLGKATWIEYLYLLFRGERPTKAQGHLLEGLAVALANPGPRNFSVQAAMIGGAGASTSAACLMAALAVNNGTYQGAREVFLAANYWQECGKDLQKWQEYLHTPPLEEQIDVWLPIEHAPGFDPHGVSCATPVLQTLQYLSKIMPGGALTWLQEHRHALETAANAPLAITGVAAATFLDLGCGAEQAEMLYLLLCLPGAAAHALEQRAYGLLKYPFFADGLELVDQVK